MVPWGRAGEMVARFLGGGVTLQRSLQSTVVVRFPGGEGDHLATVPRGVVGGRLPWAREGLGGEGGEGGKFRTLKRGCRVRKACARG